MNEAIRQAGNTVANLTTRLMTAATEYADPTVKALALIELQKTAARLQKLLDKTAEEAT